jgi:type I restriction enzyme M protein
MDNGELKNTLKRLCKVMWDANVTNPITYVTQISYLLFLKMLEEIDVSQKAVANHNHRNLFGKFQVGNEEVDFDTLRWSRLTSDPDNERMLRTLRDTLPLLAKHPLLSQGAKAVFQDAAVVIPTGATLRRAVDIISPISFTDVDADVKGDLYEMLSAELGSQKKAAQFRTPRHLIRVIVQMVDPKIGQTICDSACGSGGFLIEAYNHILLTNTSRELIKEKIGADGLPVKRGIGDKLTRAQWDFLQKRSFYGFEGDQDIIRIAAMNAVLHQFDQSEIVHRDSICGSEDKWDEMQFDVILENPPFSGSRGDAKASLRIEKGDKYVLFMACALRSLRQGGTAGIILPKGFLYGDSKSHNYVKERLIKEFDLKAVVLLPRGMFEPYTPNPTCFLIFRKSGKPTEKVWFYNIEGDGSSLKKAHKFGPQYRNDFPDLLSKWPNRKTEEGRAWIVPAEKIVQSNYNMTLAALELTQPKKVIYRHPKDILKSTIKNQSLMGDLLNNALEILTNNNRINTFDKSCQKIKLGNADFFTIVMGQSPSSKTYNLNGEGLPFLQGAAEFGELNPTSTKFCSEPSRVAESNDVLISIRAPVGITNLSDRRYCIGRGLAAIRCTKKVIPKYLFYCLRNMEMQISESVRDQGGGFTAIKRRQLREIEIPIPISDTHNTQLNLVELIDSLLVETKELRKIQAETETDFDSFVPALLAKAFQGKL